MKLKWTHTERLGKGGATGCKEDNAIMANNDLSAVVHESLSTIAPNQESTCSINIKSMWTTTKTNLFVHSGNPYLLGLRFCHCCSCWINIDPKVLRETANGVLRECCIYHLVKINSYIWLFHVKTNPPFLYFVANNLFRHGKCSML